MLRFSEANTKTRKLKTVQAVSHYLTNNRKVYSLDMLSGWSCPAARDCLSRALVFNQERKIVDGPYTQFRCFSASQEVLFPNVYDLRANNLDVIRALKTDKQIAHAINASLPKDAGIIRYHVAGDFFKASYLYGALLVAQHRPDILFYSYTKTINLLDNIDMINPAYGIVRNNFMITASIGGKYDTKISQLGIRTAKVVFSEDETDLPIDHDDSHAATAGTNFALLLHGTQPAGSEASKALWQLRRKVTI